MLKVVGKKLIHLSLSTFTIGCMATFFSQIYLKFIDDYENYKIGVINYAFILT